MLNTEQFGKYLETLGYRFYSGVPCSFLKPLINYSINECEYVMAANEGDAVAICAGAYLTGKKAVTLMQNSGLGNAVSPLTSLNAVFHIPVLGFVSLRGETGVADEPQHELMGVITDTMLQTMKIPYEFLSSDFNEAKEQLKRADAQITDGKSFFLIVKKDTFSKMELKKEKQLKEDANLPTRNEILQSIKNSSDKKSVYIATTGFTGRELYELEDTPSNFYMVGSLGCTSSLALGIACCNPHQKIIVLDGDGAVLMRMGSLAVNAAYHPANMIHILLDNQAHESTGGQFTVSSGVDYAKLADAVGYKNVITVHTSLEMQNSIQSAQERGGLTFIYVRIKQGAPANLGRPKIKPYEVTKRVMEFLKK